jgi:hypothetical protein
MSNGDQVRSMLQCDRADEKSSHQTDTPVNSPPAADVLIVSGHDMENPHESGRLPVGGHY